MDKIDLSRVAVAVKLTRVAPDRLATEIRRLPGAGRVAYRIDPELFKGQALLYLSTDRLTELRPEAYADHGCQPGRTRPDS